VSQQINLFNPLFLKRKEYFSVLTMLQALALLLVGLAVFYGFALQQEGVLERQAADSIRENALQKERLSRLTAEYSPGAAQKQAEEELRTVEAAVTARESLLGQIQSGTLHHAAGYSEYLRAFARQIVSGVWLTGVNIDGGAQNLTLTGNALQADLVPAFIRRLSAEEVLRGRTFSALSITQSTGGAERKGAGATAVVAFRLSSTELPEESGAARDSSGGAQ